MTAEVAILNKEAVAIAADSASTIRVPNKPSGNGQKIFTSANKIFALSKYHSVGIMIYGNAQFMEIPWETIIKIFRKDLGNNKFDTLEDYADKFIQFLQIGQSFNYSPSVQENFVKRTIYFYFHNNIMSLFLEEVSKKLQERDEFDDGEMVAFAREKLDEILVKELELWENGECNLSDKSTAVSKILNVYEHIMDEVIIEVFEEMPISETAEQMLKKIASLLFVTFPKHVSSNNASGIVITGFGEKEIFPSITSFSIECFVSGILKFRMDTHEKVNEEQSAMIMPFAQREMVDVFIKGISTEFRELYNALLLRMMEIYPKIILDSLNNNLSDKNRTELEEKIQEIGIESLKEGMEKIDDFRYDYYIEPILNVVTFLPKDELAEMAESLVNLTSLRKKISMDDETVGGPIDVAVISKGDGLVWIKRKHYFTAELNQAFFANYFRR